MLWHVQKLKEPSRSTLRSCNPVRSLWVLESLGFSGKCCPSSFRSKLVHNCLEKELLNSEGSPFSLPPPRAAFRTARTGAVMEFMCKRWAPSRGISLQTGVMEGSKPVPYRVKEVCLPLLRAKQLDARATTKITSKSHRLQLSQA